MGNKVDVPKEILDNAIAAIELGLEDYETGKTDSRRLLSSVRNLFAGILLLFKSKLAELSIDDNESLLKQKILPVISNGTVKWIGEGKKTVDVQQIKERFKSLDIIIDWKPLDALQNYRNEIEHYFDKQGKPDSVVSGLIASNFMLIIDFMQRILGVDPKTKFSEDTWHVFLNEKAIYDREIKAKKEDFQRLMWFSPDVKRIFLKHRCSACDSELIRVDGEISTMAEATTVSFVCRNCGEQWTYSELAKEIADDLSTLNAWELKDGGQEIIGYCPACRNETYCTDGNICLSCGEKGPFRCSICDTEVPICELPTYEETKMCGWCAHAWEKCMEDDDE